MVMQRGAADGSLPFVVYDPEECSVKLFPAALWACGPGVAMARFLRGAVSLDFPNHAAPEDPKYLPYFNATFLFNLYVHDTDFVRWLRERMSPVEQVRGDPHGTAAREGMLLAAISAVPSPSATLANDPLPKKGPGRGESYDWQVATAALLAWDGEQDAIGRVIRNEVKQSYMVNYWADWFMRRFGVIPSDASLKKRVKALVDARREDCAEPARK